MGWGSDLWGGSAWSTSEAVVEDSSPLAIEFDCQRYNVAFDIDSPGVVTITMTPSGAPLSWTSVTSTVTIEYIPSAIFSAPVLITSSTVTIPITIDASSWVTPNFASWVWAGRIGAWDFEQDDGGEASRRPMPFEGAIYRIKKLGVAAIVYGDNGVTRMTPHGVHWGIQDLHKGGVKGRTAVCGTPHKHYFIDKIGMLYKILPEQLPEKIDFSNLFFTLGTDTVLSYDDRLDIIYITDNSVGYALTADGLGKCPANITGVGYKGGVFYITAPATITNSPLEIATDIIDFGVRTEKTINYLDFGIALSNDLYAALDYRWSKDDSWTSTSWRKVDDYGRVSFMVTATEFRIKAKLTSYEDVRMDYINIFGKYIAHKAIMSATA